LARTLLGRAARLASDEPIPRDLLVGTLELAGDDPLRIQVPDAFRRLVELGLLQEDAEQALRLHRLLAAFVRAGSVDAVAQGAVERVMLLLAAEYNQAGYPAPLAALQRHLRAVVDAAQVRVDSVAAALCNELGYHLWSSGDYAGARP